jgi:chromosome partitioning protein
VELIDQSNREYKLREVTTSISDRYDYILIDCPPSLNLLTVNGLVAARDGVIIPVQCEYLALEGLGQLVQTLNKVRARLFPELKVRGVVMTMYDGRTKLAMDVVEEVKKHFPVEVFMAVIPRSVRIAEAPSYGVPITIYAPDSTGARAYNDLACEILASDGIKIPEI